MSYNPRFSASVLSAVFKRKGGSGQYTHLFSELSIEVQSRISSGIKFSQDEKPVLACFKADNKWFLLTTERIAWVKDDKLSSIFNTDIQDVSVDLLLEQKRGVVNKKDFTFLKIITRDNQKHLVELEPGNPHIGTWNVLKTIAAKNGTESMSGN